MLNKDLFNYWMGVIGDRTGRVLAEPTYREYYRALSGELDDAQFAEAARVVFRDEKFWPEPAAFISAVKPSPRLEALKAFERIRKMGKYNGVHRSWVAEEIERELGKPALEAFRTIGGGERFETMHADAIAFTAKDFADAYLMAKADAAKPPVDAGTMARINTMEARRLPAGSG